MPISTTPNSAKTNRLINEKSPYLLQHAHNPVDWYPWGSEAFEAARTENKPIFLSIGYSTCHWCHVMERESFEDLEVAKLLNETFIAIKVDREERPDIDQIYMEVCQAITGSGGWPLTIIMTPDKKPFFATTYIPKETRFGHVGFMELIPQIKDYWAHRRQEVLDSAEEVTHVIQEVPISKDLKISEPEILELAFTQLSNRFDKEEGGFSDAPKFPTPHIILFLLRYWKRTGNANALQMVEKTLQAMRRGGIFDHIGFGFHRYSTDFFWLVPHFEKMLYDQALLVIAYTETFEATKKEEYATTAREILTYILREMTAPEGGFYSAEDADSKDEAGQLGEGKFYVWKETELKTILNNKAFELAVKTFNIKKNGNFLEQTTQEQTGENILHLIKPSSDIASELNVSLEELKERIETIRKQLFEVREKRAHPNKDDKVLTDWNGLMVAAFAKAARDFSEPIYTAAGKRAVDFILKKMRRVDGRLLHRYRNGEAAILANLEDYAFLIWGLLEMYQTTFDVKYLQDALKLDDEMLDLFWDKQDGGFFFTPRDGESLLVRKKDIYDGAIPSGNSVAMWDLLHLEKITGKTEFAEKAMRIVQVFSAEVSKGPAALTQLMVALEFAIGPSFEVVIAGNPLSEDTKTMIKALRSSFLPNLVVLVNPTNQTMPLIRTIAPYLKDQQSIQGKATAYVCVGKFCKAPVTDVNAMLNAVTTNPD
jgi:uncharacterized protein YyaL (SSP411 family)